MYVSALLGAHDSDSQPNPALQAAGNAAAARRVYPSPIQHPIPRIQNSSSGSHVGSIVATLAEMMGNSNLVSLVQGYVRVSLGNDCTG